MPRVSAFVLIALLALACFVQVFSDAGNDQSEDNSEPSDVVKLTTSTFKDTIDNNDAVLVKFFAPYVSFS